MSICLRIGAALICAASTTACSQPSHPTAATSTGVGAGAVASPPAQQLGRGAQSAASSHVPLDFGEVLPGAVYQKILNFGELTVSRIEGPMLGPGPFEVKVVDSHSVLVVFKPVVIGHSWDDVSVFYAGGGRTPIAMRGDVRPVILEKKAYEFPDTRIGDSSTVRLFIRKVAGAVVDLELYGSSRVAVDNRDCVLPEESCAIDAIFTPETILSRETWGGQTQNEWVGLEARDSFRGPCNSSAGIGRF